MYAQPVYVCRLYQTEHRTTNDSKTSTVVFKLVGQLLDVTLDAAQDPFTSGIYKPSQRSFYINVLTPRTSAIVKVLKQNTASLTTEKGIIMVKDTRTAHELASAKTFKAKGVPVLDHDRVIYNGHDYLIRSYTTPYSLGDLVYAYQLGDFDHMSCVLGIPIQHFDPERYSDYHTMKAQIRNVLNRVIPNVNVILDNATNLPVTLDNIDCNGMLYDFGDYPSRYTTNNTHVVSAIRQLAVFSCLDLTQHSGPVGMKEVNRNQLQSTLHHGLYIDKLLALNELVATNSETPNTAPVTFVDSAASTTNTAAYYSPLLGFHVVDWDLIRKNHSEVEQQLIATQDPSLYMKPEVLSIGDTIFFYGKRQHQHEQKRKPYYNLDMVERMQNLGINLSDTTPYHYQCATTAEAATDFLYYNYNSPRYFDPSYLRSIYTYMLNLFKPLMADETKLDYVTGAPRMSSMGVGVSGYQQKTVWNALPEDFADRLLDTASKTALPFCTKVVLKFARGKKARARTVGGSSFTTSTLFRMLHKPITNRMVATAQENLGPFLIGVSKFNLGFHNYLTKHHPDGIEDCDIMGADYTKCDRSFPLVCRALAACLFYDLANLPHDNFYFINEVMAYMTDFSNIGGNVLNKPGGTTSGDSTTAFSNSFYNYFVHLTVQFLTFLSSECEGTYMVINRVAHTAYSTGKVTDYEMYFDLAHDLNSTQYFLHFLSDDSFIISKPNVFPIFTTANFSVKLQSILGCVVDQSKSWSTRGEIHEFCSSTIHKINGFYQYVPDPNNMLAGLIVSGEPVTPDKLILKVVATLAEIAVHHFINPALYNTIFQLLQTMHAEFVQEHGCSLLPEKMLTMEFYINLLQKPEHDDFSFLSDMLVESGVSLQSASQCYFCENPTVNTCSECPVQYPMCAYCSYIHLRQTGHVPSQTGSCYSCECVNPLSLSHCIVRGTVRIACEAHSLGMAIPLVDHHRCLVRLPLYNKCELQKTDVGVIQHTALQDDNGEPLDPGFFLYDNDKTPRQNYLKLLHDCYMLDESANTSEPTYTFTSTEPGLIEINHPLNQSYGYTAYAAVLDSQKRTVLKVTLDVLSYNKPNVYHVSTTKGTLYSRFSHIRRITHTPRLMPRYILDKITAACFVIGPPGTGKTTFVMNTFIEQAGPANKVAYCAPTHKLVQSMDSAIFERYGTSVSVSITKSELNNNVYNYPANQKNTAIMLGTPGAVAAHAGCTLIFDEVTLSQLNTIVNAIMVIKPKDVVFLGDPFQLGPVTHLRNLAYDYTNFPLYRFTTNNRNLGVCFRCPSKILSLWAKPYTDAGINISSYKQGGMVKFVVDDCYSNPTMTLAALSRDNPDKTILCNYKKPVLGLQNAMTIDSSQGKTFADTIVVLLGNTNFTKVMNRAIVALSRSTQSVEVHLSTVMYNHFKPVFDWPERVVQQHEYTRESNLTPISAAELPLMLHNLAVCDLEFYHLVRERTPKVKCTLEVGEMSVLTTSACTQILLPRKGPLVSSTWPKTEFGVPKATPKHNWDYMRIHKGISEQANTDRTHKIFSHLASTTTDDIVYVLFGAQNDLRALSNLNVTGNLHCTCGNPATFFALNPTRYVCHQHATGQTPLMGTVNAKYIDLQTAKNSLAVAHSVLCTSTHGTLHTASTDTVMTSCILSNLLQRSSQPLDNLLNTALFHPYKPYLSKSATLTTVAGNFRTFGTDAFTTVDGQLYHFILKPHQSRLAHFLDLTSTASHSSTVVDIPTGYPSCVHIRNKACSFCANTIMVLDELYNDLNSKGVALAKQTIAQYTPLETATLVQVKQISYNSLGKTIVQLNNGDSFPFIYDMETSVHNYVNRSNKPIPNPAIFKNLGIMQTFGFSTPWVPMRKETTNPHTMSTVKLPNNNDYYLLTYSEPINTKAASSVDAGYYIFETPMVNTGNQLPPYYITRIVNQVPTTPDIGYFSTNRIVTRNCTLIAPDEQYIDRLGHHVTKGDTSQTAQNIGGMHVYSAFDSCQFTIISDPSNAVLKVVVAKEHGNKETTAIDVTLKDYYTIVSQEFKVSKTIVFSLDGGSFRMMSFKNDDGEIQTAYPVAQSTTTSHKITPSYIIWPNFYTNEPVDKWDIPNYNAPPKNQTSAVNIHKFDQITDFFTTELLMPVTGHVHHLGNAGNMYSPGDIVLETYFDRAKISGYDIRDCITSTTLLHPDDSWRAHLILSDVYEANTDFSPLLERYLKEHLHLGGSVLWKMTETSTLDIPRFIRYFGTWKLITFAVNYSSSETFLWLKGYTGTDFNHAVIQHNIMGYLGAYRSERVFVPYVSDYTGNKRYKDTGRVKEVQPALAHRLTPSCYATSCLFIKQTDTKR
nr:TPA_inf: RdRp [Golden Chinese loach bafinivirus]